MLLTIRMKDCNSESSDCSKQFAITYPRVARSSSLPPSALLSSLQFLSYILFFLRQRSRKILQCLQNTADFQHKQESMEWRKAVLENAMNVCHCMKPWHYIPSLRSHTACAAPSLLLTTVYLQSRAWKNAPLIALQNHDFMEQKR